MWFNFGFNAPFATRNLLFSFPLLTIVPILGLVVLSMSYAMLVCERPVRDRNQPPRFAGWLVSPAPLIGPLSQARDFTYPSSLWLIMITMSAVGRRLGLHSGRATRCPHSFSSARAYCLCLPAWPAGYGDVYPVTYCGRGVSVSTALVSIVTTAILIGSISAKLALMPFESRMVEFLERSETNTAVRESFAALE